jgi:hypothetical protein
MQCIYSFFIVLSLLALLHCDTFTGSSARRGMEEHGSEGLFKFVQTESAEGKFLSDVDFFCISVRACNQGFGSLCSSSYSFKCFLIGRFVALTQLYRTITG